MNMKTGRWMASVVIAATFYVCQARGAGATVSTMGGMATNLTVFNTNAATGSWSLHTPNGLDVWSNGITGIFSIRDTNGIYSGGSNGLVSYKINPVNGSMTASNFLGTATTATQLENRGTGPASISTAGNNGFNISDADGSSMGITGGGITIIFNPASAIPAFALRDTNNNTIATITLSGFTGNGSGITGLNLTGLLGTNVTLFNTNAGGWRLQATNGLTVQSNVVNSTFSKTDSNNIQSGGSNNVVKYKIDPTDGSVVASTFTGNGNGLTALNLTGLLGTNVTLFNTNAAGWRLETPNGLSVQSNAVTSSFSLSDSNNILSLGSNNAVTMKLNPADGSFSGNSISAPTNTGNYYYPPTADGSTSWGFGTTYTNSRGRVRLEFDVSSQSGTGTANQIFVHYTNSGVAHLKQNFFPLDGNLHVQSMSVTLSPGATFEIDTITGTAGSISLLNQDLVSD